MERFSIFAILFVVATSLVIHSDALYQFEHQSPAFGPNNDTTVMSISSSQSIDKLAYESHFVIAEPVSACYQLSNNVTGKIVLVARNNSQKNCSFAMKVYNVWNSTRRDYSQVESAGGIGVIVMNQKPLRWEEDTLIRMGKSDNEVNVCSFVSFMCKT